MEHPRKSLRLLPARGPQEERGFTLDFPLPGAGEVWRWVSGSLIRVAYGDGRWVAVGEGGTLLTSTDGLAWQSVSSGTGNWLFGVAYGGGRWVAVGQGGNILTSP